MSDLHESILGTESKTLETTDVLKEDEEQPRHQGLSDSADAVIRQQGSDVVGILLLSLTTVVLSNISR